VVEQPRADQSAERPATLTDLMNKPTTPKKAKF
jgi:hypothetical protein